MNGKIIIKGIEFTSKIGVTSEERRVPQPVRVDLEVPYEQEGLRLAAASDHIGNAIDYATLTTRVVDAGTDGEHVLLESLADRLVRAILVDPAIPGVTISVRKLVPPVQAVRGPIEIRVSATRADVWGEPEPAPFLMKIVPSVQKGLALDVAAGRGRNTLYLAQQGFTVEAIDRDLEALQELDRTAKEQGLAGIKTETMELEDQNRPPTLGKDRYDAIIVFYYLYRPLFPLLREALKPGGTLIYQTFLLENHERYGHPRRREFCLAPNELLHLTQGLRVIFYEEGPHGDFHDGSATLTARLAARKEQ